jgi:hypothetical protein
MSSIAEGERERRRLLRQLEDIQREHKLRESKLLEQEKEIEQK